MNRADGRRTAGRSGAIFGHRCISFAADDDDDGDRRVIVKLNVSKRHTPLVWHNTSAAPLQCYPNVTIERESILRAGAIEETDEIFAFALFRW